ncbi:LuxR C-terminal-related transcriptional regulator [Sporomusa sp. KB1]|jgi:LuxR family maltose regulon positive regulatory protein|uniref:helix-turn-helix transcriptional regulator n=1 Tax=Sporomusa sp. KB1 TaxID=943346 RepID=UPI0011A60B4D|nr:LuxR C-terminal-related transcriptional regulator [Sporomusa sp. KB1]TWH45064.1 LuxR family maltose regulon positive regulatory protein [Sporomusa sp. KB1]
MTKIKRYNAKMVYFPKRLTTALGGILYHALTIVEAPMGYGKTTAVREYLNKNATCVLWQPIYNNSLSSFWKAFCNLFARFDENSAQSLLSLELPTDSTLMEEALRIIAAPELLSVRTILVIDDYHLIETPEVDRFIEFLTLNQITNLHIVLIARFTGLRNMEELALKGYLHYIAPKMFEFAPKEITAYYKECGISLNDRAADELYTLTEGWISALYLLMLEFIATGSHAPKYTIYKLLDKAVYIPLSSEIKEFLLTLCIFDRFTLEQAVHMWGKDNAEELLTEVTSKNAFVKYDLRERTYYAHNIFTDFLREALAKKDSRYRKELYQKAGRWHLETGDYFAARHYFYECKDFDNILVAAKGDHPSDYTVENKELLKKYLEECPNEVKARHHYAILKYALHLFIYKETDLFNKICSEFRSNLKDDASLASSLRDQLLGEFEIVLCFAAYNDIKKMSEHQQKAWNILGRPTSLYDNGKSWTFGSPSILYLYYRKSGHLQEHIRDLREGMIYYRWLTNGHGSGAEYAMEAEMHFDAGDFVNAEIASYKALSLAEANPEQPQTGIIVCALFLRLRLALVSGNYFDAVDILQKMRTDITSARRYLFFSTADICEGYMYALLRQPDKIPQWVAEGSVNNSRLMFPAFGAFNIVYGRVLLVRGEYLKLIGNEAHFNGIASVFPNLLGHIYTYIYLAAANKQVCREAEALSALKKALDIAMADKLYMPFVENCDYIKPLLEELYKSGLHREGIDKILTLYAVQQTAVKGIIKNHFFKIAPQLTSRELEIARLAAEGISNREIGIRLFISENTVKTQLKSAFKKLGVNSRVLLKQQLNRKN